MQRHNGASLLEVLVAIGVFATVAITSFLLLTSELQFLPSSRSALQAVELAEEGLEASRAIRDLEWSALATGTHGLVFTNSAWGFQATSDTMDGFTRQLTVTERSTNERSVESTVRWTGMLGRAQSFTLTTTLSNWRNLIPRRLFGNWQNPQTLGTIDLGPGNQGRSIAVRDGYVYMAASAENESRSDFFVIDATSGTHPIMRGSINTADLFQSRSMAPSPMSRTMPEPLSSKRSTLRTSVLRVHKLLSARKQHRRRNGRCRVWHHRLRRNRKMLDEFLS